MELPEILSHLKLNLLQLLRVANKTHQQVAEKLIALEKFHLAMIKKAKNTKTFPIEKFISQFSQDPKIEQQIKEHPVTARLITISVIDYLLSLIGPYRDCQITPKKIIFTTYQPIPTPLQINELKTNHDVIEFQFAVFKQITQTQEIDCEISNNSITIYLN